MALTTDFSTKVIGLVNDLTSADKVTLNQAIFQETFALNSFATAHNIDTNVRHGNVIPIILNGEPFLTMPKRDQTSCDFPEGSLNLKFSAKKWDLSEYAERIPICMRQFDENFLLFWNMYRQRLDNPTTTPDAQAFLTYIIKQIEDRIIATQWRVGYFGDTTNASDYINGNNGFFTQAVASSGYKKQIVKAGAEPTGEELLKAIENALNDNSGEFWLGSDDIVIKTSWQVANKIVIYLNSLDRLSQYNCTCVSADGIVRSDKFGVDGLRLFGYKVEAHREIDGTARVLTQNPFQLIISRKSNLRVATNTMDKLEGFDMFYDQLTDKVYIKSLVYLGVAIALDEYIYLTTDKIN